MEPHPLKGLEQTGAPTGDAAYDFYAVGKAKMKFGRPTPTEKAVAEKVDRTTIHYNDDITLSGIPAEAYRYQLGSRSAIEWIIERFRIKTDKASGIVNDPNELTPSGRLWFAFVRRAGGSGCAEVRRAGALVTRPSRPDRDCPQICPDVFQGPD